MEQLKLTKAELAELGFALLHTDSKIKRTKTGQKAFETRRKKILKAIVALECSDKKLQIKSSE